MPSEKMNASSFRFRFLVSNTGRNARQMQQHAGGDQVNSILTMIMTVCVDSAAFKTVRIKSVFGSVLIQKSPKISYDSYEILI